MANTTRKKRRRSPFVRTILRLFFILLLLSMLAAYISNQVSISSRRAELQTLNEQIEQQKTLCYVSCKRGTEHRKNR